ncbi:NosY protein [Halobacteriales archaeon QS_1_68_20]|nr:MAG: NosY protein [Halobacteriales archaeon QS_1_68_20]
MTTTWRDVARKDFADAVRSKMVWGVVGVFVSFMGLLLLVAGAAFPSDVEVEAEMGLAFVAELAQLFVPLVALIAAYMSVVGERRSGSIRVLLSYPFTRFDVVAGKLVGRAVVIGSALLVGLVVTLGLAVVVYGVPEAGATLGLFASVLLFGLAFTGLGVGISAASATRGKAMAAVIGIYLLFLMFWEPIAAGVYYVLNGTRPGIQVEAWYFLLKRLSPIEAFRALADSIFEISIGSPVLLPVEDTAGATPEQLELANRVAGELPFYLSEWVLVVVLLAWGVVPAALGYLRFRDADLG